MTIPFDPTKFGAVPVSKAAPTNSFDPTKFGAKPVSVSSSFRYKLPEPVLTSPQKIEKYKGEQVALDAETKKANSFGGIFKNTITAKPMENLPFVGGAVKVGNILNKTIDKPVNKNQEKLIQTLIDRNYELAKIIKEKEKAGKDASADKKEYNSHQDTIDQHKAEVEKFNAELPTNKQGMAAVAQTGIDLLTVGSFGKSTTGMKPGNLEKAKPSIIPRSSKLFSKETLKEAAINIPIGGAYGASEAIYQGEDTGGVVKDTIIGSAIAGILPYALKAPGAIKAHYTKNPLTGRSPATQAKLDKAVEKRTKDITDIENNYVKLRNKQENPTRVQAREDLAKTDLLNGAVDENGLVRTKSKGGAVEKFNEFVSPYEDAVSKAIAKEGVELTIDDVKNALIKTIEDGKISGADRLSALKSAENEALGLRTNKNGKIDLSEVQNAKIYKYSHINYSNPAASEYDKAVARTFKEIIENNSKSIDVKATNKDLSRLYAIRELLEDLDGRKVKGGKLGKYFAQTIGAIVGGKIGGAPGAIIASEIAGRMQGKIMSSKLTGKGSYELQATENMKIAARKANMLKVKSQPSEYTNKLPVIKFGEKGVPKFKKSVKNLPTAEGSPKVYLPDNLSANQSNKSGIRPKAVFRNKTQPKANKIITTKGIPKIIPQTKKKVNILNKLKNTPEKDVIKKASDFLDKWTGTNAPKGSKSLLKKMDPKEIDELSSFFNKKFPPFTEKGGTITLYRGIEKGQNGGLLDRPTAWTRIKDVAKEHTYGTGKVEKIVVKADQVLLDTTSMPPGLAKGHGFVLDEEEVILKPLKKKEGFLDKLKSTPNKQGGFIKAGVEKIDEDKLTTKFLDYAKNKTTLSRQEIEQFARRPELKKGEANLLNEKLKEFKDNKISTKEFTDSMRRDLLELTPVKIKDNQYKGTTIVARERDVDFNTRKNGGKNYEEVVFESPITTNGSNHYPNSKGYFAHARGDEVVEEGKKIWREQEIQSDLMQKDNLKKSVFQTGSKEFPYYSVESEDLIKYPDKAKALSQLEPFTNDRYGERILRERIKEKTQKGYSKYRLPTPETIGKIEGFQSDSWVDPKRFSTTPDGDEGNYLLKVEDLKVGSEIQKGQPGFGGTIYGEGEKWIIVNNLGNGRFKAIKKDKFNKIKLSTHGITKEDALLNPGIIDNDSEIFDLTGASNPQARRYSDWGKFLKNKYGGKEIVDPQGNSWIEIDLKKEYGKLPVDAFGKAALNPLFVGAGVSALGVLGSKLKNDKK